VKGLVRFTCRPAWPQCFDPWDTDGELEVEGAPEAGLAGQAQRADPDVLVRAARSHPDVMVELADGRIMRASECTPDDFALGGRMRRDLTPTE
jgi:hypothetical protein